MKGMPTMNHYTKFLKFNFDTFVGIKCFILSSNHIVLCMTFEVIFMKVKHFSKVIIYN